MVLSTPENNFYTNRRSVTPVVATVLLVAITLVIGAVIGAVALGYTEEIGGTTVAAGDNQCVNSIEFDPEDVASFGEVQDLGCVVWYDASQLSGSPGTIDRWPDSGPNGFDLTDSDDPRITNPSYDGSVEGVPAVKFESENSEGLSTEINTSKTDIVEDTTISVTALVRVQEGDSTVFQTGKPDEALEYFRFGYNDADTDIPWFVFAGENEVGAPFFQGHEPTKSESENKWRVVTHIHDGNGLNSYVDGQREIATDSTLNVSDGGIQVGYELAADGNTLSYMNGHISEIVVFEKPLSDTERGAVECAIDRKHGDAVNVAGC